MLFSDLIVCVFSATDPSEKGNHIGKSFENQNFALDPFVRIPSNLSVRCH